MLNNRLSRAFFHLTSVLTTWSPRGGARFLDTIFARALGSRALVNYVFARNLAILREVRQHDRILVISDIHIGDAVITQAAATAFRDFFPDARIDFVCKQAAACLMEGSPDISNLYPVFTGTIYPNTADTLNLKRLIDENRYDLCLNCCPFLRGGQVFPNGQSVLNLLSVAPQLARNDRNKTGIIHLSFQAWDFVHSLLSKVQRPLRTGGFTGARIALSDRAIEEAQAFLKTAAPERETPIVFLNPDAGSKYTRIPFGDQAAILGGLASLDCRVFLGSGFTEQHIGQKLLASLPSEQRAKIVIVPTSLSLDGYAALTDCADVFISGDTGPLHIAAARKVSRSGGGVFRNQTFVISLFGATPARLSGYDSSDPLYFPANQDAPSRTYVAKSPCRNITCVNKLAKTCRVPRCFETLDTDHVLSEIRLHLNTMKTHLLLSESRQAVATLGETD